MAVDTPGMYLKDGQVFKVQISQSSGRPYALMLVGVKGEDADPWSYDAGKGWAKKLSAHDMMTLEQAKEYGCLHGVCCVCGARLTNPKSIEAGIGPICAKGEQFANPNATKVYQTDEYRAAAIAREDARKAAAPAVAEKPARLLDYSSTAGYRQTPAFMLSWSYDDADFGKIKNVFKSFEWSLLHQKWDGANKVWTCSATPDTIPVVLGFAKDFNFTLSPAAQTAVGHIRPDFQPEAATMSTPQTFAQLAALVS